MTPDEMVIHFVQAAILAWGWHNLINLGFDLVYGMAVSKGWTARFPVEIYPGVEVYDDHRNW